MMQTNSLRTVADYALAVAVALIPWHAIVIIRDTLIAGEKWQYGTIGIYLGDLILCAAIALVLVAYHTDMRTLYKKHTMRAVPLLLCAVWCACSALWSADALLSLTTALRLLLAIALASAVCVIARPHILVWAFIVGAAVQATLGIWQFATQTPLPASSLLGVAAYDVTWGGNATITTTSGRWLRAYGAMPHPNILVGYVAIALCLMPFLLPSAPPRTRGLLIGIGALLFLALLCTGSRSALFALLVGGMLIALRARHHFTAHRATIALFCSALLLTTILFGYAYRDISTTRTIHSTTVATNALHDRLSYTQHARALIALHPLRGVGIGTYTLTARNTLAPDAPMWQLQPVHNIYLLILAEIGLIGVALFLWALWSLCAHAIHTPRKSTLIAAAAALLCIGFFDHWPWTAHVGITTAALCIGLLYTTRATQDAPH